MKFYTLTLALAATISLGSSTLFAADETIDGNLTVTGTTYVDDVAAETAGGDFLLGYNGVGSLLFGDNLVAPSANEIAFGQYNLSYTPVNAAGWDPADRLFSIGVGMSGSPSNALTILKSGAVGIGTTTPASILEVNGTVTATSFVGDGSGLNGILAGAGSDSLSVGQNTNASGIASIALGKNTTASGIVATALGRDSVATSFYGMAMGLAAHADSFAETSLGYYPRGTTGSHTDWIATETLFEIGNGVDGLNRHNALTILKNGHMSLGEAEDVADVAPDAQDELLAVYGKATVTGDTAINGTVTASAFVGDGSGLTGIHTGGGLYSFVGGADATADGYSSFAFGDDAQAYGYHSIAFGESAEAVGHTSVAIGVGATAHGRQAISIGDNTQAIGYGSMAFGWSTRADGRYATSLGFNTSADSYLENSLGAYSRSVAGNATEWITTDTLFEIGNGTSMSTRHNALTILKNGHMSLGEAEDVTGIAPDSQAELLAVYGKAAIAGDMAISGAITAQAFVGDGSGLTGLPAGGGDLVDDTSPALGGDLDVNGHIVVNTAGDGSLNLNGLIVSSDGSVTMPVAQGDIPMGAFQ